MFAKNIDANYTWSYYFPLIVFALYIDMRVALTYKAHMVGMRDVSSSLEMGNESCGTIKVQETFLQALELYFIKKKQ